MTETQHQITLMTWAKKISLAAHGSRPELGLLFHIPNGGGRSKREAGILKAMGVRAGVSDLFLPVPAGTKHGLWLELKAIGGAISTEQRVWLGEMKKNGYSAFLCVGWEEARDRIVEYLGGEFPAVDMSEQITRLIGAEKK
jgi:hypothetical protein